MGVLGEAGSLSLLRSEEALMSLGDLEEPSLCISMMSQHNTILQLNRGYMQVCSRQGYDSQSTLPENLCFPVDQRPKPARVARTVLPTNPRQAYRLNAAKLCDLQSSHRPEVCGGKPVASDQRSGGQTLYVTCVAGCPHSRQLYAYKLHFRQTYDLNRGRSRQVLPHRKKGLIRALAATLWFKTGKITL
jgi:hypothetical protein